MDMDGVPIRQHRSLWRTILAGMATGALVLVAAGCGGQSAAPGASTESAQAATSASGSASSGQTPLAEAVAFSQCMRSHGVPNWPDPVPTPSGGYGYRTTGIDSHSAAFQGAWQACKALPSPWHSTGQQLSPAQQQAWLNWAKCIRGHGVPNFPDPTFSSGEVRISGAGGSSSPQFQTAQKACRSLAPSGIGG